MEALAEAARGVSAWSRARDTRFTRFRGDGWQMHVADPGPRRSARRSSPVARLRAADAGLATRVAIGIGQVDSLGSGDLADARGPAFETSGRALDRMPRTRRLAIDGERGDGAPPHHRRPPRRAHHPLEPRQAEAMALHLAPDNPTLTDIAPHARHLAARRSTTAWPAPAARPSATRCATGRPTSPPPRPPQLPSLGAPHRPARAIVLETAVALAFGHSVADFLHADRRDGPRTRPARRSCSCTSASSPPSAGPRSASRSSRS